MTILSGPSILARGIIRDPHPRTEIDIDGIKTTFGLSGAGYDLRLDGRTILGQSSRPHEISQFRLEPGEFMLASAMEHFIMPCDVAGIVHDKSSWARRGLVVQNTVLEPGWTGYLTLELTNHGPEPLTLYAGMGICQVVFHLLDAPVEAYSGKYQNQPRGPVAAR